MLVGLAGTDVCVGTHQRCRRRFNPNAMNSLNHLKAVPVAPLKPTASESEGTMDPRHHVWPVHNQPTQSSQPKVNAMLGMMYKISSIQVVCVYEFQVIHWSEMLHPQDIGVLDFSLSLSEE